MLINGQKFPNLIKASSIDPVDMTWLWYPYIPVGSATLIFGPGGMGKSHITVDIAARISSGRALPGQDQALPAQNVLMMSAEDEADRVLVPRLIKAHADLDRIHFPAKVFTLDANGLRAVEHYMENMAAGIVFIDPLVAYIGGKVDINKANETRVFTGGLHEIAKRSGVPIIVVGHSRKGVEGSDADRAMGSADFVNAVRSVLFVTKAGSGERVMRHAKVNYAKEGPTLGFEFDDDGFRWTGVYDEAGVKTSTGGKKVNEVHEWLRERLANGPVRATELETEAAEKGFSHRSVVRGKVGIAKSELVSVNGKLQWYWRLIEGAENGKQTDEADVPVMGSKWKAEITRQDREIIARTEERTRRSDVQVVGTGPKIRSDDERLTAWMKENL